MQLLLVSTAYTLCIGQIEASTCPPPPGKPRAFDTFAVPGRREFDYQSFPGGGEFEPHPRFHVKSLAWRAMGDPVLEDFRGKDQARNQDFMRGGANEAKVDQTTEMYFLLSDPFIYESSNT